MKKLDKKNHVLAPLTLEYLLKKGTVSIVFDNYSKLKSNIAGNIVDFLEDEEKMSIYLTYYMLYKFPSLSEKLATFSDSFEKEITDYINILFYEFINLYYFLETGNMVEQVNLYKSSLNVMFDESKRARAIKEKINNKNIHNAALIYLMNGNNVYIDLLDREIDVDEIENYIYNDISCLDQISKLYRIMDLKKMGVIECKDYISEIMDKLKLFDVSNNLLNKKITLEKTRLFEIIIASNEQINTIKNNIEVQNIRRKK